MTPELLQMDQCMSAEYSVPSQSSGTQYMPTGKSRSVNNGSKSPAPVMTHESLLTMRSSGSATARVFTIEASGRYSSPTSVSAIAALSSSTSGARAARGGIGFEKVGAGDRGSFGRRVGASSGACVCGASGDLVIARGVYSLGADASLVDVRAVRVHPARRRRTVRAWNSFPDVCEHP